MDNAARNRLKAALAHSDWTADALSNKLFGTATYVSRVTTGRIQDPSPTRLQAICDALEVDITFILTGRSISPDREELINSLATAPESVIADVAEFVRQHGLVKK
ncbi:helix-turn-helix domain-containing protein [Phaeobacter inhibens]|uniref:helix-turn-helix domain-containing protein n=1 Tax=Phaeobacter inhibens TaxID=221822 RepID=UPI0021A75AA1|nr:helix-turn-helix transcriptional regulator [Phaeobacter inhibens]UWR97718.1 helix-turn-helix domain-containing protein [Phaeobacter inhibens]